MKYEDYKKMPKIVALNENNPASILTRNGTINEYRRAFAFGQGGSIYDETFDPKIGTRGGHKCCGSKVWWRHKVNCKNSTKNAPDDYSDLKEV